MSEFAFPPVTNIPPDTGCPSCPWCRSDMSEARVRLEDLVYAHQDGAIANPERQADGTACASTLVLTCPTCERPSMLRLWERFNGQFSEQWGRLIPVRTSADARFIAQEAGHVQA